MYKSRRLCVHRDAKRTTRKVRGVCRLLEFREDRSKRSGRKFVEHARPVVTIALVKSTQISDIQRLSHANI